MRVIAYKNLPTRWPIAFTWLTFLTLEQFNAPQWAWGAASVVVALGWILTISGMVSQVQVNVFTKDGK